MWQSYQRGSPHTGGCLAAGSRDHISASPWMAQAVSSWTPSLGLILIPPPRAASRPGWGEGRGGDSEFSHVRNKTAREGRKEKEEKVKAGRAGEGKRREKREKKRKNYRIQCKYLELHLNVDSFKRRNKEMTVRTEAWTLSRCSIDFVIPVLFWPFRFSRVIKHSSFRLDLASTTDSPPLTR